MQISINYLNLLIGLFLSSYSQAADLKNLTPDLASPAKAVIFIHGFLGKDTSSWTNTETNFYFPSVIAKALKKDTAVLSFEYPAACNSYSTMEASDKLSQKLANEYPTVKEVSFVAHSFGGLIARRFILDNGMKINKVITLGTPNLGSTYANWLTLTSELCDGRTLQQLQDRRGSTIDDLNTAWIKSKEQVGKNRREFEICAAYETLAQFPLGIIVNKDGATQFAQGTFLVDKNHIGMSKPRDKSDEVYTWVKRVLTDQHCLPASQIDVSKKDNSYKKQYNLMTISQNPSNDGTDFVNAYGEGRLTTALKIAHDWPDNFYKLRALAFASAELGNELEYKKYLNKQKNDYPEMYKKTELGIANHKPINWNWHQKRPNRLNEMKVFPVIQRQ